MMRGLFENQNAESVTALLWILMKDNEDAVKAVVENFIISGILDEEFKAEKFIEIYSTGRMRLEVLLNNIFH